MAVAWRTEKCVSRRRVGTTAPRDGLLNEASGVGRRASDCAGGVRCVPWHWFWCLFFFASFLRRLCPLPPLLPTPPPTPVPPSAYGGKGFKGRAAVSGKRPIGDASSRQQRNAGVMPTLPPKKKPIGRTTNPPPPQTQTQQHGEGVTPDRYVRLTQYSPQGQEGEVEQGGMRWAEPAK